MPKWAPSLPSEPLEALSESLDVPAEIVSENVTEPSSTRELAVPANGAGEVSMVDSETELSKRLAKGYRIPSHGNGLLAPPGFPPDMERAGRPPSPTARLRDRMRDGLDTVLTELFADVKAGKVNRLQFADFLAKYGIGATGTVTHISPDVVSRLERQAMLVASRPQWDSRELLLQMRDIWA